MNNQEKRKLKPAPLQTHPGQRRSRLVTKYIFNVSLQEMKSTFKHNAHIMRKMPPQFAVEERFVGASFGFRPSGPRIKPRRLHTTTRRTTQHTATHVHHLKKRAHVMTCIVGISATDRAGLHSLPDILGVLELWQEPVDCFLCVVQCGRHSAQSRQREALGELGADLRFYVIQLHDAA